jgi:hypothetical protein
MTDHETPAAQLARALAKLSKSPWLAASGHAGTLKAVVDYLGDQQRRLTDAEARLAILERAVERVPGSLARGAS